MPAQSYELYWPYVVCAIALAAAFVALLVFRKLIDDLMPEKAGRTMRPVVVALAVLGAFLMIELPYNRDILAMDALFALLNLAIVAAIILIVYFAALRSRVALGIALAAFFVAGIANGFVVEFRGQPVLLSDILALSTAAEVATGYSYVITDEMLLSLIVLEALLCALAVLPKAKATRFAAVADISIAALFAMIFAMWYDTTSISEEYECTVDAWSSRESYEEQGAILCLLQRAQDLVPQTPEGYSIQEAESIRELIAEPYLGEGFSDEELAEAPSIVVIMNETFSDISAFEAVSDSYEGPTRFKAARRDALLSGDIYVSALGGSTCNSEFEFLTGASVGLLGPGIYPYMLYSMEGVDNVASYLSELGYGTTAIHPAEATNWRRNIIYDQMGFDTFYDIETMRDSETIRGLVTDAATYDIVLDILETQEAPQFIFDVTIANHGGYQTGEIPEDEQLHTTVNGANDAGVDEYISLIERSDIEFAEFLEDLQQLDRPVVVCMFGDHQSGYADALAEASLGIEVKDMTLDQAQERFVTPYIVWTNSDEIRKANALGVSENMGLSYLAANVLRIAGLPLDEQLAFNYGIQQVLPAVNLNGYMDTEGIWRYHGEDSVSDDAYNELEIVQYGRLFDK